MQRASSLVVPHVINFLRAFIAIVLLGSASIATAEPIGELETAIRSGDLAAAIEAFERKPPRDPADRDFELARIHLLRGETSNAVDLLERALDREPGNSELRLWLSRALFARASEVPPLRKPFVARAALKQLKTALELDPDDGNAAIDLILIHLRVPLLGDGERAARKIERELTSRGSPLASFARGIIFYEQGRWGLSERNLLESAEKLEDPRRVLFWLGYLYQKLQRWDEAFDAHAELLRLSPNDPRVWFEIGRTADFSGERVAWAAGLVERYIEAVLPAGAPSTDRAQELLSRLRAAR